MAKWKPRALRETGKAGIESQVKAYHKSCGGYSMKFVSPGIAGPPDRVFGHENCNPFWMELKAPGKKRTPRQIEVGRMMRAHGFDVIDDDVDSLEKAKRYIDERVYGL